MDDLISRQDAIDAVYKCTDIFINNLPVMVDKADAYKALANLPSAQPEPQKPYSICDLCIYNPASSMDGKPCSMCVAQDKPRDDDSWSYG